MGPSAPTPVDYTLAVAPVGSSDFTPIRHAARASIADGDLGTFDPTMLADGAYDLRLTATNAGGNTPTVDRPSTSRAT